MEETYTFSRALHLMRYGGKKMRSVSWEILSLYLSVERGEIKCHSLNTGSCFSSVFSPALTYREIMGSWVEVKE